MTQGKTASAQQPPVPVQEEYSQYTIRIRKGSLAAQGLARHAQRFGCRYEAGWIAKLVDEFYQLIDGPDPRASLVYPLLYHLFEQQGHPPPITHQTSPAQKTYAEEEEEAGDEFDLTEIAEMAENLRDYL